MELPKDIETKLKIQPTQSQRLRASLYRLWEIKKLPNETADKYYHDRMEEIITWIQSRISNPPQGK